ncbi:MAG: hypothetical protein ABI651_13150 [Verrucomicrobiota bacterium]
MTSTSAIKCGRTIRFFELMMATLVALQTGCRKDEVKVYQVPKENPRKAAAFAPPQESQTTPIRWTPPAGWTERPASAMRVGSFSVSRDNRTAEVSVIPLGGQAGGELENVNRWREQAGLGPISRSALASEEKTVDIGGSEGRLFEIAGAGPDAGRTNHTRIIAATLLREGTTWFFKMMGEDSLVREEKDAFARFLKSVRFDETGGRVAVAPVNRPASTNAKQVPAAAAGEPSWDIPANWQEQPAQQMVLHSFVIANGQGGKASVTITTFPGDVGGTLANVNRWRNQLNLEPVEQSELSKLTTSLDVLGGKAMLVDMTGTDKKTNQKARLMAAMVGREGGTWFYKLMGDEQVVAREKEAFIKFVQSIRYPNG